MAQIEAVAGEIHVNQSRVGTEKNGGAPSAWIIFKDDSGVVTVEDSYNMTVNRTSNSRYVLSFGTAMDNINYMIFGTAQRVSGATSSTANMSLYRTVPRTVTEVDVIFLDHSSSTLNSLEVVMIQVFGGKA